MSEVYKSINLGESQRLPPSTPSPRGRARDAVNDRWEPAIYAFELKTPISRHLACIPYGSSVLATHQHNFGESPYTVRRWWCSLARHVHVHFYGGFYEVCDHDLGSPSPLIDRFTNIFKLYACLFLNKGCSCLTTRKLARGLPDIATSNTCNLDSKYCTVFVSYRLME